MTKFAQNALLTLEKRLPLAFFRPEAGLRVAATVVNAVLVIAVAYALASLALTFWFGPPVPAVIMPAATAGLSASASILSPPDEAAIAAWHLFGRLQSSPPVAAPTPPPAPLPVTPLNLRLVGIFFLEQSSDRALALIAEANGVERGYRAGEALPGGGRLERVQRDHVVVSRNGRQEVLNLPKLGDPNSTPPASPPLPTVSGPEAEPTSSVEPQLIDASVVAQRLRGEMATRPQALEDIAFANPYVQNGQFLGFRLRPGRDRQLLQQLGLNSGDVVTEINGSRLNNPMQGFSMLQEVMNADQISVRVLRNGAELPLTFSLGGSLPR